MLFRRAFSVSRHLCKSTGTTIVDPTRQPLKPQSIFASLTRTGSADAETPAHITISDRLPTPPAIKPSFSLKDKLDLLQQHRQLQQQKMTETLQQLIEQNQTSRNWLRVNRRINGTMSQHEHLEKIPTGVGIIYVIAGRNNTICTLTNWEHKVLTQVSGGMCGLKGHNRGTAESGTRVGSKVGFRAIQRGFKDVFVVLKGFGPGRDAAFRSLMSSGLEIRRITDRTPIQHGGCKPKRARRV